MISFFIETQPFYTVESIANVNKSGKNLNRMKGNVLEGFLVML